MSYVTVCLPYLNKLHLLPNEYHIHVLLKYHLLTYKAINLNQLPYLSSLSESLSPSKPSEPDLMNAQRCIVQKKTQTIRTQDSVIGFRKQFKNYLFRLACPFHSLLAYQAPSCRWTFFWELDYLFLDSSVLENVHIVSVLCKCFIIILVQGRYGFTILII